jgi:hypothetical protein
MITASISMRPSVVLYVVAMAWTTILPLARIAMEKAMNGGINLTPAELAALVKAIDSLAYGDLTFSNEPNPFVAENDARVVSAFRAHWPALRTALLALQDVRRDALEEAAKVCDDEVDASESNPAIKSQWSRCAEWCAAAIRALAASEKEKK